MRKCKCGKRAWATINLLSVCRACWRRAVQERLAAYQKLRERDNNVCVAAP